eukprot:g2341.t1
MNAPCRTAAQGVACAILRAYGAKLVSRDSSTRGNWRNKYGSLGYKLFNFCGKANDCKKGSETQQVHVSCTPPEVISSVQFADFGLPAGDCDGGFKPGSVCGTPNLTALVAKECVGHASCTLECSDYVSLHQRGCNITADSGAPFVTSSYPSCAVAKAVVLQVACGKSKPCRDTQLPRFVSAVTSAYDRGKEGSFDTSTGNVSADPRALQSPEPTRTQADGGRRIGKLAEGVIIAVDIAVPDSSQAPYDLTAYFVDWERQGRQMRVSLLNATESKFDVIAPSQLVEDFGDGVYLTWRVRGSVRIRVAHIGGDPGGSDAVVSALFFDPAATR